MLTFLEFTVTKTCIFFGWHLTSDGCMFFPSKDPTYNTGKFGEIKELLLGMLDTYTYESVSRPVNFQSSNTCHQVSKQVDIPWWDWRLIPPYLVDSRLTQTNDTFEKPENMRWLSGMVAGLFKAAYLYSINDVYIQYEGIKYLKNKYSVFETGYQYSINARDVLQ